MAAGSNMNAFLIIYVHIVCNQKLIRALLYGDNNSLGFGLF
jgi:hypothetical protein